MSEYRPRALPKPCPAALGAFGVPARRWATRADLFNQLKKGREFLRNAPCGLGLADAAAVAGISDFHFSRLFKDTFGESPAHFHRRSLIERATSLLTSMSVSQVADELGYRSVSAFVRSFRLAVGCTPGAFKKKPPTMKVGGEERR